MSTMRSNQRPSEPKKVEIESTRNSIKIIQKTNRKSLQAVMKTDMDANGADLLRSNTMVLEGRYFHGIIIFMAKSDDWKYFILDSKTGVLSIFDSLSLSKPNLQILVC